MTREFRRRGFPPAAGFLLALWGLAAVSLGPVLWSAEALAQSPATVNLADPDSVTGFFLAHGFERFPPELISPGRAEREERTCLRANRKVGGDQGTAGLVGIFVRRADRSLHALCYFSPQVELAPRHAAHACRLVGMDYAGHRGARVRCAAGREV